MMANFLIFLLLKKKVAMSRVDSLATHTIIHSELFNKHFGFNHKSNRIILSFDTYIKTLFDMTRRRNTGYENNMNTYCLRWFYLLLIYRNLYAMTPGNQIGD